MERQLEGIVCSNNRCRQQAVWYIEAEMKNGEYHSRLYCEACANAYFIKKYPAKSASIISRLKAENKRLNAKLNKVRKAMDQ